LLTQIAPALPTVVLISLLAGCGTDRSAPPPATRSTTASAPAAPAAVPPAATATAATAPAAGAADLQAFKYHAIKMGSDYNLVLYAPDAGAAEAAAKAAEVEIDRLDAVFSDYNAESELSKLSRLTRDGPMAAPTAISRDLYTVLALAQAMAKRTDGALDVTIGPYVQLWRRSRRQHQLPTPERLADARKSVGWKLLKLHPDSAEDAGDTAGANVTDGPFTAQLLAADMRLDVGGIAMGYISDRVLSVLRDRGIRSAICDLSGDLAVGDPPPGRPGWRIAIQSLSAPGEIAEYLEVANRGVSTSGDSYRFVEIDGVRYSHIVDPRTGLGLTRRIGVTIVAADGVTADVMATTLSVVGAQRGMELFKDSLAARIVYEQDGAWATVASPAYRQLRRADDPRLLPRND